MYFDVYLIQFFTYEVALDKDNTGIDNTFLYSLILSSHISNNVESNSYTGLDRNPYLAWSV